MGEEAKKRLELYREFRALAHFMADIYMCLPILQIEIRHPKARPRRNVKRPYVAQARLLSASE